MRDDLIPFLASMRSKATDFDVCEATAAREIVRSFTAAELGDEGAAADLIIDVCRRDASEGKSGRVRYEIIASKEGKRLGRQALSIDTGRHGEFSLDDANAQGVLIECIRDKRDIMRMAFAHQEELFKRLAQQLELMASEKKAVEEMRLKMFDAYEYVLSGKSEREIHTMKAQSEAKAVGRMVEAFVPLLPAAANRLLSKATGQKAPLLPESLKSLLGSFDEEQLSNILPHLKPAQQAALLEIMSANAEAEESAQKKAETYANGAPMVAVDEMPASPNVSGGVG